MEDRRAQAAAWLFWSWALVTIVFTPMTRVLADHHGYSVTLLPIVDVLLVLYAIAAALALLVAVRRRRSLRPAALLAILPLLHASLAPGGLVGRFAIDRSDWPWDLVMVVWIGNVALLALVVSALLFLLSEAPQAEAPAGPGAV